MCIGSKKIFVKMKYKKQVEDLHTIAMTMTSLENLCSGKWSKKRGTVWSDQPANWQTGTLSIFFLEKKASKLNLRIEMH